MGGGRAAVGGGGPVAYLAVGGVRTDGKNGITGHGGTLSGTLGEQIRVALHDFPRPSIFIQSKTFHFHNIFLNW